MSYNETKQHGTEDFPFQLYEIDKSHPRYQMAFHWHGNIEIIRIISGKLTLTLNNNPLVVQGGDVIFVNSETIHGGQPDECKYECLVFNLAFLKTGNISGDSFIDQLLSGHCRIFERIKSKKCIEIIDTLFSAMKKDDDGFQLKVIGLANVLLGEIVEEKEFEYAVEGLATNDKKSVQRLKKVLAFIRENFDKEITLDDMAESAGLSTKYFCSFFKDTTDKTPVAYLNAYRIERAARKLIGSDASVTQIAYSCGFNDLSYFIKTFKEIQGCSPNAYRKGERGAQ